jgi:hypothetical protein
MTHSSGALRRETWTHVRSFSRCLTFEPNDRYRVRDVLRLGRRTARTLPLLPPPQKN